MSVHDRSSHMGAMDQNLKAGQWQMTADDTTNRRLTKKNILNNLSCIPMCALVFICCFFVACVHVSRSICISDAQLACQSRGNLGDTLISALNPGYSSEQRILVKRRRREQRSYLVSTIILMPATTSTFRELSRIGNSGCIRVSSFGAWIPNGQYIRASWYSRSRGNFNKIRFNRSRRPEGIWSYCSFRANKWSSITLRCCSLL